MPALLVDTTQRPASSSDASSTSARSESASPNRPPVSPITPRASVAHLAPVEEPTTTEAQPRLPPPPVATFTPQPPSVAISESDNPDVIALRSAISILQLQREKSKRDLKALADLKTAAVADPAAFVHSIQQRRAQAARSYTDLLTPTLAGLADTAPAAEAETKDAQARADARKDSAHVGMGAPSAPAFPAIPQSQNIVRCPPINWDKYHIVGEPLDKLHEEQKKWPGQSEPPRNQSGHRAPSHSIAAPYSPFEDGIRRPSSTSHAQPPKGSKKSPANGS